METLAIIVEESKHFGNNAKEIVEFLESLGYHNSGGMRGDSDPGAVYYVDEYDIIRCTTCYSIPISPSNPIVTLEEAKNKWSPRRTIKFKVDIPDGFEIDKENSTLELIVFKEIIKTLTFKDIKHINGYYINTHSDICEIDQANDSTNRNVFLTEKHAKSALAMAQISQLIPHYGGEITDEEWNNQDIPKFVLSRNGNDIKSDTLWYTYEFIAFHTKEQRDAFLEYNEQLVIDYFMLD